MDSSPEGVGLRLVGEESEQARALLASNISDAARRFYVYQDALTTAGVAPDTVAPQNAFDVLRALPLLDNGGFQRVVGESILNGDRVVDMETSSGTTGPRKRRVISEADDASETEFLARLFDVCGIGRSDRVACVDTGPLTLMTSFTKALDAMGVAEAYCISIMPDAAVTTSQLADLRPTVLISIPSVLDRLLPTLQPSSDLKAVVYAGEPLPPKSRNILETQLGVEVFAYYGASETSALGIECAAHDGVHLFTDRNVFEIAGSGSDDEGELVVTTLHQDALPLLRYPLKDVVTVKPGRCPCGLEYPRVDVKGRSDDTVSVLGTKLSYETLSDAIHKKVGTVPIEIILTATDHENLTVSLPERLSGREKEIRDSLLNETELGFLVGSRLLDLDLQFKDESTFTTRKRHIQDTR